MRVVTPHGLRGTHANVAKEVGVSGVLLAAAMGHKSETTTTEHYAGRGAVAQAAVDRVAGALRRGLPHSGARGLYPLCTRCPSGNRDANRGCLSIEKECGRGESNSHNRKITRT